MKYTISRLTSEGWSIVRQGNVSESTIREEYLKMKEQDPKSVLKAELIQITTVIDDTNE